MTTPSFKLNYDYRCPFAKIMHLHVLNALKGGATFDVTFMPWSLNQPHRHDGDPDVWDDPRRDGDLYALAASVSVRDQQPEHFLAAHEALFLARHADGVALKSDADVLPILEALGVDVALVREDIASRRPHKVIGESHHELDPYEPFGVPTFFVGDRGVFVRYMDDPTEDTQASAALIDQLVSMIVNQGAINEFKHTTLKA